MLLLAALLFMTCPAQAVTLDNLELKARVGYNIGGSTPVPLPETIRSIDSYGV